jgi:hypothetical protein
VFIRKSGTVFCIISIYVDVLNIIGHTNDIDEASNYLKKEFEIKDLDKNRSEEPPCPIHTYVYV